jgi:hypothetical protein
MTDPAPGSRPVSRRGLRFSSALGYALILAVVFAALLGAWALHEFLNLSHRVMSDTRSEMEAVGREMRSAFVDIAHLQPRITINNHVYLEQTTPTSELTVLSRRIEVDHEFQHSWAGSSKHLKLHGTFNVKAGFDLRQDLSVDVQPDAIIVKLPHAQILGVEQQEVQVLVLENGLWNYVSATDVQSELSTLPDLARQRAIESGLTTEAERALQRQLDARIHTTQPLHVKFGPEEATPERTPLR